MAPHIDVSTRILTRIALIVVLAVTTDRAMAQTPQGTTGSSAPTDAASAPDSSERENMLLERIQRLEEELTELQALIRAKASDEKGVAAAVPQDSKPAPPSASNETAQDEPLKTSGLTVTPFGTLNFNTVFNSSTLVPGSVAFFAAARTPTGKRRQLIGSPGNSLAGLNISVPAIGNWKFDGRFDFNFRGQTPVIKDNVFEPYFADLYIRAVNGRHTLLLGQAGAPISPLGPRTLVLYPGSTIPGNFGGGRPQARYEFATANARERTFTLRAAIAQPVQTYQVSEETVGQPTAFPDVLLRAALGHGVKVKTFEVGVGGHYGHRRSTQTVPVFIEKVYTTWSGNIDAMASLGKRATVKGELFVGQVLGDFGVAIQQTFNPFLEIPIRAVGGWAQIQYEINPRWSATGGFGIDNPNDDDLSRGFRSKNEMVFANAYYAITSRLHIGTELSYWYTHWVGLPDGRAIRVENSLLFAF